jgi:hypothetical protein
MYEASYQKINSSHSLLKKETKKKKKNLLLLMNLSLCNVREGGLGLLK